MSLLSKDLKKKSEGARFEKIQGRAFWSKEAVVQRPSGEALLAVYPGLARRPHCGRAEEDVRPEGHRLLRPKLFTPLWCRRVALLLWN